MLDLASRISLASSAISASVLDPVPPASPAVRQPPVAAREGAALVAGFVGRLGDALEDASKFSAPEKFAREEASSTIGESSRAAAAALLGSTSSVDLSEISAPRIDEYADSVISPPFQAAAASYSEIALVTAHRTAVHVDLCAKLSRSSNFFAPERGDASSRG
ncbi:MAG: hypothetical protein IPK00_19020 [Deltaproteobacteria bacterium]|nr:hypothetical protein [Deltaproteobacteria bacterium]